MLLFLDQGSSPKRLFCQGVSLGVYWGTPSFQTPWRVVANGIGKENMILSRDIVLREDPMGTRCEDEDMESSGRDQEDLSWKEVSS